MVLGVEFPMSRLRYEDAVAFGGRELLDLMLQHLEREHLAGIAWHDEVVGACELDGSDAVGDLRPIGDDDRRLLDSLGDGEDHCFVMLLFCSNSVLVSCNAFTSQLYVSVKPFMFMI